MTMTAESLSSSYQIQNATVPNGKASNSEIRKAQEPAAAYQRMLVRFWDACRADNNWDGFGAPEPWAIAARRARLFIEEVHSRRDRQIKPVVMSPIVDGGVGLFYKGSRTSIVVEFYNDGAVVVLFKKNQISKVKEEADPNDTQIIRLAGEVQDFLIRN